MAKKSKNSKLLVHYTRTMTPENLSRAANYVGKYVLKGLGAFGKIMTAPFVQQGPTSATIYKSKELLTKERTIENKSEELLGKAMTWVSPLNYGAALATGNGLNARKGEEEVASWSPAWQAVGRLGELYVGPKAVKGVKSAPRVVVNTAAKAGVKPAKAAVVAREIKLATKNKPKYTRVPSKNLFRTQVYKGGEITDPYSNFVTTDPLYAANYGKVTPYIFESRSVAKAKEPMMGSSDPVTMDMFIYNNTKRNPNATAIIGHDAVTGEFTPSKGTEILNMNPKNLYPVRTSDSPTSLAFFERKPAKNNIVGASLDYSMKDSKGMDFIKQFFALLKINGKEYTLEGLKDAKNVQQGLPEYIQSYLNLNTVERAVRAMRKNGYSEREILLYVDKVNEEMNKVKVGMYSDLEYNAAGALDFGGFYNSDTNFISINKDALLTKPAFTPNYIMKHEGRHLIDYNTSMTDDVINILEKAYDKDFLEIPKHEDAGNLKDYLHMDRERVTTNRDAREVFLSNLEKRPGEFLNLTKFAQTSYGKYKDMVDFLNELILYAEPEDIINAVENSNGYGKRYINYLKKNNKLTPTKIEQLRLAMIHVPSYLLPVAGGYTLYNIFNQPQQQLQYLKQGGKMNIIKLFKNGGQVRKMQTAAGGPLKKRIKRLKDGYRYIPDERNGGWDRISDNEMSDIFATYVVKGKDKRADVRIDKKSEDFDRKFKYDETEIPFIKDKEITLTNAGLYTGAKLSTNLLDSIAKYAKNSGLPLKTAVGLVAKETSLGNPTVDSSLKKLAGDGFAYQLAKALNGGLHINEGKALNPKDLINFHYEELNPYLGLKNIAYKKSVGNMDDYGREGPFGDEGFLKRYRELLKLGENYSDNLAKKLLSNFNPNKNVLQAGFEFYKLNPRKYNYNQTNYPLLVEERGNMVYNSPEFKSWLSTSEYKKQGGKMNILELFKRGGQIRKMLTASGGPLFPWLLNTEWVDNWKFRTTPASRSRVLSGKGVETDKQYTERRKKETTKRTWRSDAADIAHGIGEGVLALHPYTAIPYFGAKVGLDFLNGTYGWHTALNASVPLFHLAPQAVGLREATNVALEDAANAGSKTARNWRVAREVKRLVNNGSNPNTGPVIIPQNQISIESSTKPKHLVPEGTYPVYRGPKFSISSIVNPNGTVNPRQAMRVQHTVAELFPGAHKMELRLENPVWHKNDPTTFHHTKNVTLSAWSLPTPEGFTKQDLMVAALGHDFGKIISGDGHAQIGADLAKQVFPDLTEALYKAIAEHMGTPKTPLGIITKLADIVNGKIFNINEGWRGNRYVLDKTTLEGVLNFIDNDIIPRMLRLGHDVPAYTPVFRLFSPETDALDNVMRLANSGSGAWFTPASNDVTLRGPLKNQDFGLVIHEAGGHGLRYNMLPDYVPTERQYLNEYVRTKGLNMSDEAADALLKVHTGDLVYNATETFKLGDSYPWVKTYFERNPSRKAGNVVLREQGSINSQFRSHYSDNGRIVGKELDKVVDLTSGGTILRDLIEQPYTSSVVDDIAKITGKDPDSIMFYSPEMLEELITKYPQLQSIVSKVKDTMKIVGGYTLPIAGGTTLYGISNRKQGGKMNIIEFLKKGSGIHIKEKNKGKFTSYCGGKVTDECILKGKNSSNPAIRKRATFAANARKWKHAEGGILKFLLEGGTSPKFLSKEWINSTGNKINKWASSESGLKFISNALTLGLGLLFSPGGSKSSSNMEIANASLEAEAADLKLQAYQNAANNAELILSLYSDPDNPNANKGIFADYVRTLMANLAIALIEQNKKNKQALLAMQQSNGKTDLLLTGIGLVGKAVSNALPKLFSNNKGNSSTIKSNNTTSFTPAILTNPSTGTWNFGVKTSFGTY